MHRSNRILTDFSTDTRLRDRCLGYLCFLLASGQSDACKVLVEGGPPVNC